MSPEVVINEASATIEGWTVTKNILVILAHPDDPEFFCGGTIARWCAMGHKVSYCLLTQGQRGWQNHELSSDQIGKQRMREQREAGDILGVGKIDYLDFMDGELLPDLELRNAIIRLIRTQKPEIVVTSDPRTYFTGSDRINHPDHRAAGMAVFDAIFPAAGNSCYRVKNDAGIDLDAHQVEELWLTLTQFRNTEVEVTNYFETRLQALLRHRSQIREPVETFRERMASKLEKDQVRGGVKYVECFYRVKII